MHQRTLGWVAIAAVIGVSVVLAMSLGTGTPHGTPQGVAPAVHAASGAPPLELAAARQAVAPATSFADVVEQALPAVVAVTSTQKGDTAEDPHRPFLQDPFFRQFFDEENDPEERPQPRQDRVGEGSGFIISPDGYILTNNHVIEDYDKVEIGLHDGQRYEATVVGTDRSIDLALLKIDPGDRQLVTLPLGDSEQLRVGEWVIAIGNPLDFEQTVTVGVVSGKERRVSVPSTDAGVVSFIQTDAAINLGNSGGPLLDARGTVVGINTAIRRRNYAEGIGFALPINPAREVVNQLRERGSVRRGYIGIEMNPFGIDEEARDYYGLPDTRGVIVDRVTSEGPAEQAGLRRGDVVRAVDGEAVRDNLDLISKISAKQPGHKVRLTVFRDGGTVEVQVTLGDREEWLSRVGAEETTEPLRGEDESEEVDGLGLTVRNIGPSVRQRLDLAPDRRGVLITEVDFGSDAQRKGLQPEMIVIGLNNDTIESVGDWSRVIDELQPGTPVRLEVMVPGSSPSVFFFLRVPAASQ